MTAPKAKDGPDMAEAIRLVVIQGGDSVRVKKYLSPREASDFVGIGEDQLSAWRNKAMGPAYSKVGKLVRYNLADLEAFMDARRVFTTSMAG